MNGYKKCGCKDSISNFYNYERLGGGFLLPFLTGAVVSAPFWYLGGVNRAQQGYYQPQPYPVYYPYPQEINVSYPNYYPYQTYR